MTQLFYDRFLDLEVIDTQVKKLPLSHSEKHEIIKIIDHLISYEFLAVIFKHLDQKHHSYFLELFLKTPHSEIVLKYLRQNSKTQIESQLKKQGEKMTADILKLLNQQ